MNKHVYIYIYIYIHTARTVCQMRCSTVQTLPLQSSNSD